MIDSSVKIPFGIPKTRGERLGWAGPHQEVWRYIVDWYQCCWTKPEVRWKLRSSIAILRGANMFFCSPKFWAWRQYWQEKTFKRLKETKQVDFVDRSGTRDISDSRRLADDPAGNQTLAMIWNICVTNAVNTTGLPVRLRHSNLETELYLDYLVWSQDRNTVEQFVEHLGWS